MKNTLPCPMRTEGKRQTYSESKGQAPFDWNGFLDRAEKGEYKDLRHAKRLAQGWVTCACGNQCEELPRRDYSGAPVDVALWELGLRFSGSVNHEDWRDARATLAQIEARSHELLEQMRVLKQQNPNK